MADSIYLSWEEMQQLALPPNTTMLVPPPPEPVDVPALAAGPPPRHDWLDDAFVAPAGHRSDTLPDNPDANRAAAERAEYGPAEVRLLANLIAFNAMLQYAQSPP